MALARGSRLLAFRWQSGQEFDTEIGELAVLQGRLRAIHLAAHLETTSVLSPAQIARYGELRGYGSSVGSPPLPSDGHDRRHGG